MEEVNSIEQGLSWSFKTLYNLLGYVAGSEVAENYSELNYLISFPSTIKGLLVSRVKNMYTKLPSGLTILSVIFNG